MSSGILHGRRLTVLVSGGMDSVTLLYYALSETAVGDVHVVSFDYGQRHKKELYYVRLICARLGLRSNVIDLTSVSGLLRSSLTAEDPVPHGYYTEQSMRATVVPNRNGILLAIAYGISISSRSDYVLYGAHTGDHFIYPDCRPEFIEALDGALKLGCEGLGRTTISAPFSDLAKAEILTLGLRLGVPYEKTWSCYGGLARPCLQCGTCMERTEAFLDNNLADPLLSAEEWARAVSYYKATAH